MKNKLSKENILKSSDIAVCAAACCHGYRIEKIERETTGKAFFSIKQDERLSNLIKQYFTNELKVDALTYFNYLKEIKTQIYNLG